MKRFLAILLILVCVTGTASASLYSGISIDQLRQLISDINAEIVSRPEWKETTVPAGVWTVGTDIPAGTYSLRSEGALVLIWRREKNDYSDSGLYFNNVIDEDNSFGKVILEEGMVFDSNAPVIFAPPQALGF